MRNKAVLIIFVCVFFFSGCAAVFHRKKKPAKDELPITQKFDLDGDRVKEVITAEEDKSGAEPGFILKIKRTNRNKVYTLAVPGRFISMGLIGLNLEEVDHKQIALSYRDLDDCENLAIYKLGNDRLTKIFGTKSICGIESDLRTALIRIRISKPVCDSDGCVCPDPPHWETWVWAGERFIKELR